MATKQLRNHDNHFRNTQKSSYRHRPAVAAHRLADVRPSSICLFEHKSSPPLSPCLSISPFLSLSVSLSPSAPEWVSTGEEHLGRVTPLSRDEGNAHTLNLKMSSDDELMRDLTLTRVQTERPCKDQLNLKPEREREGVWCSLLGVQTQQQSTVGNPQLGTEGGGRWRQGGGRWLIVCLN